MIVYQRSFSEEIVAINVPQLQSYLSSTSIAGLYKQHFSETGRLLSFKGAIHFVYAFLFCQFKTMNRNMFEKVLGLELVLTRVDLSTHCFYQQGLHKNRVWWRGFIRILADRGLLQNAVRVTFTTHFANVIEIFLNITGLLVRSWLSCINTFHVRKVFSACLEFGPQ